MTTSNTSRGVLMFAHNNTEIDYLKLAVINALLIQKNMGLSSDQITIVTDQHSYDYTSAVITTELINTASSNIVLTQKDQKFSNMRSYHDTANTTKKLSFYNLNRCDAYDISPYDETLLLDVDYLILDSTLNHCWGHNNELMMNWEYTDVMENRYFPDIHRVSPTGITQYWATVVYFQKSRLCESFFNTVKHVSENFKYYKNLYKCTGSIYRNDHSFSIAAHTVSGFQDRTIPQLPVKLYKTFDLDDIHSVPAENQLMLYVEKPNSPGEFVLTRWKNTNLHVMNKWAINRVAQELIRYAQ